MKTDVTAWNHQQDVVYGYKDGMALVMDVFTPSGNRNGAGVIRMMSGGMVSSPDWSHKATNYRAEVRSLLEAGYVVFAVAHSCQPKYTIDEIFPDITRAVRFIRHNAVRFGIDPQRIGIMGASSGGHLSLLVATAAPAAVPEATDPVDRESSRVQAVVAYYAGTDNLNFGRENVTILEHFRAQGEETGGATFDFHRWDDEAKRFERVTDPDLIRSLFRKNSPIAHVSAATAPVLILHGDKDRLVPLQQSEVFVSRLREVGVPHKLVVVPGVGHGFSNGWEKPMQGEIAAILDWFNQHLLLNRK
jgi:acetyl esterase/lipase